MKTLPRISNRHSAPLPPTTSSFQTRTPTQCPSIPSTSPKTSVNDQNSKLVSMRSGLFGIVDQVGQRNLNFLQREVQDESDRGDGRGRGNGRNDADRAARAAGSDKRCRRL